MKSIESRLNFSQNKGNTSAILLRNGQKNSYYSEAFDKYCEANKIDSSEDECSVIIMSDYASLEPSKEYWFWIDEE